MVKAVVYDIGHVLIKWDPEQMFDRKVGPARRKELFAAVDFYTMNARVDLGHPFEDEVRKLATQHPQYAEEVMIWFHHWIDTTGPVIDLSVHLMAQLKRKGIPVFALSNFGSETFEIAQDAYPFLTEFDAEFVSGHRKVMKPDPAFYEVLEAETGLSGADLLFADDRPENIEAANARGWKTHLFDTPEPWAERLVAEGLLAQSEAAI